MEKQINDFNRILQLKAYSENTIRIYNTILVKFFDAFNSYDPEQITTDQIRRFLLWMIDNKGIRLSYQNQLINAIKFYYEHVLKRPCHVYQLERPKKEKRLPKVLSIEEV
ncbi:phage integrase N-terminal SAM-like domain-containing protein [Bacteroidota bacterium]